MTAATPAKQKSLLVDASGTGPKKRKTTVNPQKQAMLNKLLAED